MNVIEALEQLRQTTFVDEDEQVMDVGFQPGLSLPEIESLEAQLGAPLPRDYRRLLELCRGIDGLTVEMDFAFIDGLGWGEELFPFAIPFGADGFGNFWVADVTSKVEEEAKIFFHCHDAPVLLYQGNGMAEFLLDLIVHNQDELRSKIHRVHDDLVFDVWGNNPGLLTYAEAVASPDAIIRSFAQQIDDAYVIVDLRDVPPGMGFSWGRYGARTRFCLGEERVFAYARPEKRPGMLQRLLGRG
jgi:hypothetical protein